MRLFLLLFIASTCLSAFTFSARAGTIALEAAPVVPRYLYFWATQERLKKMDARNSNPAAMPLKPIRDIHGIARQWP